MLMSFAMWQRHKKNSSRFPVALLVNPIPSYPICPHFPVVLNLPYLMGKHSYSNKSSLSLLCPFFNLLSELVCACGASLAALWISCGSRSDQFTGGRLRLTSSSSVRLGEKSGLGYLLTSCHLEVEGVREDVEEGKCKVGCLAAAAALQEDGIS